MLLAASIVALVCAPALWMVLGRPRFLDPASEGEIKARTSVIIPARDEEETIGVLLESIAGQDWHPCEVLVVDDGSTDDTAGIAKAKGARVISPDPLPEGWKGKPWACHHGAREAQGDWLLFLDADTRLLPGAMKRMGDLTVRQESVYSICPHHEVVRPVEGLSAFFNVLMLAGVNAFGWPEGGKRNAALFGQSLLVSRAHYDAVGGHESVRSEVLENFHLAREFEKHGIARECFAGRGVLAMRMFRNGLPELWASWKKGFTVGAASAARRALVLSSLWLTGAMIAVVTIVMVLATWKSDLAHGLAVAVYVLYALQCWWAFRLAGTFSFLNAAFFPVSLLFYQVLFFTAVSERRRGVKTEWKGRHVD